MRHQHRLTSRSSQKSFGGARSGFLSILLVVVLRYLGIFQSLEWKFLDVMMRLRPVEERDERITIVAIDETDISQTIGRYPIPDKDLAELLQAITTYQPRVIGLDLFRDLPIEPGHDRLLQFFKGTSNLIGIERILPPIAAAPPMLSPERVGFVDAILDDDGFLRRSLLGASGSNASDSTEDYRLSFTLQLAQRYLESEGMGLENGLEDPDAMRFGSVELDRFTQNMGGYIRADSGGNQVLVNVRTGPSPFRILSLRQVLKGNINPDWIAKRIVLIGVVAPSVKDQVNSGSIQGINPSLVTGIEFQAHAISQLLSAALDRRPLIYSWIDLWEYLWIILWGLLGMGLAFATRSPLQQLLSTIVGVLLLLGLGYGALLIGLWIPVVPTGLTFLLNSTVLYGFYLYDQSMRTQVRERLAVIDRSFDTIHNGPLQSLAMIRRHLDDDDWSHAKLKNELVIVDRGLREIHESLRREMISKEAVFYVDADKIISADTSINELLEEIYFTTLNRDLPGFKNIKVKIKSFDVLDESRLNLIEKQEIVRFVEEALCNVGKHAIGATRLTVVCKQEPDHCLIQVMDNGCGRNSKAADSTAKPVGRYGTEHAERLAHRLGGVFLRSAVQPRGICCELRWPVQLSLSSRLVRFLSRE
jgi:CHASE2 domain-containing sensor protein